MNFFSLAIDAEIKAEEMNKFQNERVTSCFWSNVRERLKSRLYQMTRGILLDVVVQEKEDFEKNRIELQQAELQKTKKISGGSPIKAYNSPGKLSSSIASPDKDEYRLKK